MGLRGFCLKTRFSTGGASINYRMGWADLRNWRALYPVALRASNKQPRYFKYHFLIAVHFSVSMKKSRVFANRVKDMNKLNTSLAAVMLLLVSAGNVHGAENGRGSGGDSEGVEKEFLNSTPSYTHVVTVVSGDTKTLYVSGQVATRDGEVPESFTDQIEAVFANMADQLALAGASMGDVIKLNGFIVDIDREKVNAYSEARSRYFPADAPPPASTLVGVAGLVRDYFLVEVEAVAVVPAY